MIEFRAEIADLPWPDRRDLAIEAYVGALGFVRAGSSPTGRPGRSTATSSGASTTSSPSPTGSARSATATPTGSAARPSGSSPGPPPASATRRAGSSGSRGSASSSRTGRPPGSSASSSCPTTGRSDEDQARRDRRLPRRPRRRRGAASGRAGRPVERGQPLPRSDPGQARGPCWATRGAARGARAGRDPSPDGPAARSPGSLAWPSRSGCRSGSGRSATAGSKRLGTPGDAGDPGRLEPARRRPWRSAPRPPGPPLARAGHRGRRSRGSRPPCRPGPSARRPRPAEPKPARRPRPGPTRPWPRSAPRSAAIRRELAADQQAAAGSSRTSGRSSRS